MARRSAIALLLAGLLMLTFAFPALAGGWATVELDEAFTDLNAGEPKEIGFTLLQHGVTPTHGTDTFIEATNTTTGEVLRFDATPDKEEGHWTVSMTLPSAGTWSWAIQTEDLMVQTTFDPISVAGPGGATVAAAGVTPAELQAAVDDATASYDKQLSSMAAQIDGLEKQVSSLAGERDTLQKQIGNLESAVTQAQTDAASASDESGVAWWLAALAGAGGAIAVGLAAFAVARWRGVSFERESGAPVPAR